MTHLQLPSGQFNFSLGMLLVLLDHLRIEISDQFFLLPFQPHNSTLERLLHGNKLGLLYLLYSGFPRVQISLMEFVFVSQCLLKPEAYPTTGSPSLDLVHASLIPQWHWLLIERVQKKNSDCNLIGSDAGPSRDAGQVRNRYCCRCCFWQQR